MPAVDPVVAPSPAGLLLEPVLRTVDDGAWQGSAELAREVFASAVGVEAWAAVTCSLRVLRASGDWEVLDTSVIEVSDEGPEYATFALSGLLHVDGAPEYVRLDCKDDGRGRQ